MVKKSEHAYGKAPSALFVGYAMRLVFRVCLFALLIYLFVKQPEKLQFKDYFGPAHGFNVVDFVFIALLVDVLSKLVPSAKISMGSLKQYRRFHVPTVSMFENGREGIANFARDAIAKGQLALSWLPDAARTLIATPASERGEALKRLLRDIDFLRALPFSDDQLETTTEMRSDILKRRSREVGPVMAFYLGVSIGAGLVLHAFGWLNQATILLWVQLFAVCDMVFVVAWCPLQLLFMKNRCCTTCQIFNWDAIMTVAPLVLVPSWFSLPLIVLAIVVLVRWEITAVHHPERFDERTNASLNCANCKDKLCYIRPPLKVSLPTDIPMVRVTLKGSEQALSTAAPEVAVEQGASIASK